MANWVSLDADVDAFLGGASMAQAWAERCDDEALPAPAAQIADVGLSPSTARHEREFAFRAAILGPSEPGEPETLPNGEVRRTAVHGHAARYGPRGRFLVIDRELRQVDRGGKIVEFEADSNYRYPVEGTESEIRKAFPDVAEQAHRWRAGIACMRRPHRLVRLPG